MHRFVPYLKRLILLLVIILSYLIAGKIDTTIPTQYPSQCWKFMFVA